MGSKKGSPSENDSDTEVQSTRDEHQLRQIESDDYDAEEHSTRDERQSRHESDNDHVLPVPSPFSPSDYPGLPIADEPMSFQGLAAPRFELCGHPNGFLEPVGFSSINNDLMLPMESWTATRNGSESLFIGFPPVRFPLDRHSKGSEREFNYTDVDRLTVGHPDLPHMLRGLEVSLRGFATWVRCHAGEAKADTKGKGPAANPSTHLHPSQSSKRKRSAAGDEEQAEDSQDDGQRGKKLRLNSTETDENHGPLLSCPFYKRNPVRYSRCLCFRLKRITDVKQHLKRKHEQPHYCAFCGEQFGSQAALKSHERDRSCTRAEFDEPEGVSEDQRGKLAFRVSRMKGEAEQWFEIWAILFPNTKRPDSAYVEIPALEIISTFREYWNECGEGVVTEALTEAAVPTGQNDIKDMVRELLLESMGTLLDRFTQRYGRNPPSVPDTGVSSTPSSNPSEPKALSLPVDSSDHTLAAPGATAGYPEAQGGCLQLDAPYYGVLQDPDVQSIHNWFATFANPEVSSTEGWH